MLRWIIEHYLLHGTWTVLNTGELFGRCRQTALWQKLKACSLSILPLCTQAEAGAHFHLVQGWRTYSTCAQNGRRKDFLAIRHSLLSQSAVFTLPIHRLPTLKQCFSTFVTPRPGKFFFYKTRARSQQIYS